MSRPGNDPLTTGYVGRNDPFSPFAEPEFLLRAASAYLIGG